MNHSSNTAAESAFDSLHQYLVDCDFKGWDYDDLLASPFVKMITFKSLYPMIAAVQLAKRVPINFRPLLGVPKLHSTKGWGFIVKGYLMHYKATGQKQYLEHAKRGLDWLLENHCTGFAGISWGNDYDYASRAGYTPKEIPTVVWTSHIQKAFELGWEVFGEDKYKQVVLDVATFVQESLERTKDQSGCCLAYSPGQPIVVHNANMLGGVALLRAWKINQNPAHFDLARDVFNWSIDKINPDGSWEYGHTKMQSWIDNYHTGYNLDCLCEAHDLSDGQIVPEKVITDTYDFWVAHFFADNGAPSFYHNQALPRDIQATAQAIESLAKYGKRNPEALGLSKKVCGWALANMQKQNGSFRYRIYKRWTNNLENIHWGQGTMLSALGCLMFNDN